MRQLSRLALAVIYGGGAVLLLLLLAKGNADALTARVGYTAISVIVFGLVGAAGARLLYHPEPTVLWGYATLLIAAVTFILIMVEIWPDHSALPETRMIVMVVISLLLGGGSLVLSGEDDSEEIQMARRVAIIGLVALGILTVLEASGTHIGPRWFGIAAVLFAAPALSLPFLRLAGEESGPGR